MLYPPMAASVSKRKSRPPKRIVEADQLGFWDAMLSKFINQIPVAVLFMFLLFIWSSSTTIISGSILHVCVSSRKLNSLYCLSAGAQPNLELPVPVANLSSSNTGTDDVVIVKPSYPQDTVPIIRDRIGKITNLEGTHGILANTSSNNSISRKKVALRSEDQLSTINHSSSDRFEEAEIANKIFSNHNTSTGNNINTDMLKYRIPEDQIKIKGSIARSSDLEVANAMEVVEEQLRVHRSWISSANKSGSCDGRNIYVYELPSKFNKDLLSQCDDMVPWMNLCKYFKNEGLGEPIPSLGKGWYETHQYSLEPIFHSKVLKHPCRVYSPDEAKLFYVPFYAGLDILRWHFKNVSGDVKDVLALDLVNWLESQPSWTRHSGKDHVFVLGKVSWDFRRDPNSAWGNRMLGLAQMQNPVKLLIERQPWEINDIGIPHPTHFHPSCDNDIIVLQSKLWLSSRRSRIAFAGAARPGSPGNIRDALIKQCISADSGQCRFLDCDSGGCDQPESIIQLFMDSEFCLQPPGDSPTRKSLFDSLVSGCIPVIFDPFTAYYQYPWHLPEDHPKYSIFISQEEVREVQVNVVERLMQVPERDRAEMRRFIIYELLPRLIYGDSNSQFERFEDAFSISINSLLQRVMKLLA